MEEDRRRGRRSRGRRGCGRGRRGAGRGTRRACQLRPADRPRELSDRADADGAERLLEREPVLLLVPVAALYSGRSRLYGHRRRGQPDVYRRRRRPGRPDPRGRGRDERLGLVRPREFERRRTGGRRRSAGQHRSPDHLRPEPAPAGPGVDRSAGNLDRRYDALLLLASLRLDRAELRGDSSGDEPDVHPRHGGRRQHAPRPRRRDELERAGGRRPRRFGADPGRPFSRPAEHREADDHRDGCPGPDPHRLERDLDEQQREPDQLRLPVAALQRSGAELRRDPRSDGDDLCSPAGGRREHDRLLGDGDEHPGPEHGGVGSDRRRDRITRRIDDPGEPGFPARSARDLRQPTTRRTCSARELRSRLGSA